MRESVWAAAFVYALNNPAEPDGAPSADAAKVIADGIADLYDAVGSRPRDFDCADCSCSGWFCEAMLDEGVALRELQNACEGLGISERSRKGIDRMIGSRTPFGKAKK